ncbi:hypothetical protein [Marinivivus vitaminiproducens]|uniref:hypothetical protein n=1 Tax=Marinivivus vitaminiproducens TaxID=3035935 RepID=UPI00279FE70F|nr:hypothetical protein P4R82_21055 [Geminicoccaceae bacterium SCSIO 64248]
MPRPIQPIDPEKEPKTKEAHEKSGMRPKDAPMTEAYGSGHHGRQEDTPRDLTEKTSGKGANAAKRKADPSR